MQETTGMLQNVGDLWRALLEYLRLIQVALDLKDGMVRITKMKFIPGQENTMVIKWDDHQQSGTKRYVPEAIVRLNTPPGNPPDISVEIDAIASILRRQIEESRILIEMETEAVLTDTETALDWTISDWPDDDNDALVVVKGLRFYRQEELGGFVWWHWVKYLDGESWKTDAVSSYVNDRLENLYAMTV